MDNLDGLITIGSHDSGTEVMLSWAETTPPIIAARSSNESPLAKPATCPPDDTLVLVVDDDVRVRGVATDMLQTLNIKVMQAGDAFEAQATFDNHAAEISAVLLDLKMPIRDGWACLRELLKTNTKKFVVICNGYAPQHDLPEFARHDENLSFLTKPYRADQLAAVLSPATN